MSATTVPKRIIHIKRMEKIGPSRKIVIRRKYDQNSNDIDKEEKNSSGNNKEEEILTDLYNNRRYRWEGENKRYVCDNPCCDSPAWKAGFCSNDQDLVPPPIFSEFKEGNKTYILRIQGKMRYKRLKDNKNGEWRILCKFDTECMNISKKNGFCKCHANGEDQEQLRRKLLKESRGNFYPNQNLRDKAKDNNKIGDETEEYCKIDILSINGIEDAIRIGYTCDKYTDIIYKFRDEGIYRSVQVKTLTKQMQTNGYEDQYNCASSHHYGKDLLIVGYSRDRTKFLLIFSDRIPECGGLSLLYKSDTSKYKENMFTDKNLFMEKLSELLRRSREYVEAIPKYQIRENISLERIRAICERIELPFEKSKISGSEYDAIIGGYKIQLKSTESIHEHRELYKLQIHKHGKQVEGKRYEQPYSEDADFDFVIIEVISAESTFYIVPKSEMIKNKVFSSEGIIGSASIMVPPRNYGGKSKYSWLLNYIDKWDILFENSL